ncbi:flagellar hook-basal body complex protein FliE [Pseudooceanicola sp. LIPI14-2-Ac024]|uniref:flagellar hook-basal body complex protein FliE n=1 Tax=Pseudooceanicola sp. LIPI14-2-Ac024 TaxID=3344875 RepID=UPI0035D00F16
MADYSTVISNAAVDGAYRSSREIKSVAPALDMGAAPEGPTFSEMIKKAGVDTVQTIRQAEAQAQAGLYGDADTQAVVEATLELDSTVKTAVAVRDKLVEAYQEIMRMPI